jgi:hypothetical protein
VRSGQWAEGGIPVKSRGLKRCEIPVYGQTFIHVNPGGVPGTSPGGLKLVDRLWIARKARQVLQAAAGLR